MARGLPGLDQTTTIAAEVDGAVGPRRTIYRSSRGPGVMVRRIDEDGLAGLMYEPPAPRARPVVVLAGSGGGIDERRASLLASHGIPALALAYFNYPGRPRVLAEHPLEYFADAFRWLRARSDPPGRRVQVLGSSYGGQLALLLAATYPDDVASVVGYVPSSVVWGSIGVAGRSPYSLGGVAVPYMSNVLVGSSRNPVQRMLERMEDAATAERAAIPVERIRGPVLLVSGTDDGLWPSTLFSERVMSRLAAHDHPYPRTHLRYDGAGHAIGPPYVPTTIADAPHPFGGTVHFGGAPQPNAVANADSWPKVLRFLGANAGGT
jgi:pimeloyl-ACP methyl ester carboxylesterase